MENEAKKYAEYARDKLKVLDPDAQKKVDDIKNEMENINDHMEDEWRKLFASITHFKAKVNA